MIAIVCLLTPGLLLIFLKIMLLQNRQFHYHNILQYILYVILLNSFSVLTVCLFFKGSVDLIIKLNSSTTFACKYFLLSSIFAASVLEVQILPAQVKISQKGLSATTMLFIYVPIAIFLFGFTKIYWAILTSAVILWGFYQFVKEKGLEYRQESVSINKNVFLTCFFLCFAIGIISGWGGLFLQAGDWHKANAVLRDLVNHTWPVYYVNGEERSALSYYIAGYLIPALFGKLFHSFAVAELTMLVYLVLGILLLFLNAVLFVRASSTKKILTFFVGMILFSGALIFAQILVCMLYPDMKWLYLSSGLKWLFSPSANIGSCHWIAGNGLQLQYRSTVINLRWTPMQYIFPCLAGITFLYNKTDVKYYVWYLLPVLLYSCFSFVGVLLIAISLAVIYLAKKEVRVKDVFSFSNISMALTLGLILIFYFWGNIVSDKPDNMRFHLVDYDGGRLLGVYLLFCLFMFGLQVAMIWSRDKRDPIFLSVIIILLIFPFARMGKYNDWILGGPTIPLFFLMLFIWEFIFNAKNKNEQLKKKILIALLCIGAIYPIREEIRYGYRSISQCYSEDSFVGRADGYGTMQKYANRLSHEKDKALIYNYFNYNLVDDIFYRYIARGRLGK